MPVEEETGINVKTWRLLQADGKEILRCNADNIDFSKIKVEKPPAETDVQNVMLTEHFTPKLKILPLHNARWRMIQRAYKLMKTDFFERTIFTATPKVLYVKFEKH